MYGNEDGVNEEGQMSRSEVRHCVRMTGDVVVLKLNRCVRARVRSSMSSGVLGKYGFPLSIVETDVDWSNSESEI